MPRPTLFLISILLLLAGSWTEHALAEGPLPIDMQSGSLLLRMKEGYVTAALMNTDFPPGSWVQGTSEERSRP